MRFDWVTSDNELFLNPRVPQETRERFERAWAKLVDPDHFGQIGIATSGSSGNAMGTLVTIAKSSFLVSAVAVNEHFQVDKSDVWMKTLPNFHVGGLAIGARAHLSGSTVIESCLERWAPQSFHNELSVSSATLLSLVPTQLFDMVKLGLKAPETLRAVIIGGGRLEPALHQKAVELGWPIYASYGFTECSSQVATSRDAGDPRLFPLSHVDVRVDSEGRIEVRSAALMTGQIVLGKDGDRFVDSKQDGWFKTEDRGAIGPDGSLTIFGRSQDFVKIGGEAVVISRLEDRLESLRLEAGSDYDAALIAAYDERLGAVIVMVTDAPDKYAHPLVERFNEGVHPFERIRSVHRVNEIPRSPLGKLLRGEALAQVGLETLPQL